MIYFLSLGSNLGDKAQNLIKALSFLKIEKIKILKRSSLYETQPVDYPYQPWFYNQVVEVETDLNPFDLLDLIKKIEAKMGREPHASKKSRIIDIDILLAEDVVISTSQLTIPHPRLEKRNFVLIPFHEISPHVCHPLLKKTIQQLLDKSEDKATVRKISNP